MKKGICLDILKILFKIIGYSILIGFILYCIMVGIIFISLIF